MSETVENMLEMYIKHGFCTVKMLESEKSNNLQSLIDYLQKNNEKFGFLYFAVELDESSQKSIQFRILDEPSENDTLFGVINNQLRQNSPEDLALKRLVLSQGLNFNYTDNIQGVNPRKRESENCANKTDNKASLPDGKLDVDGLQAIGEIRGNPVVRPSTERKAIVSKAGSRQNMMSFFTKK